ncbi:hypothetical protein PHPALM_28608 [Phytophthora palmivora]|uniref:Uncharacterized protein n=1 Tax=Phytophthora palmivora TaxID=4796 RepID=A0A2P4X9R0_9STRA|nr:hypothetical protein PHPALM_28608 [Phytophthora palmivora]
MVRADIRVYLDGTKCLPDEMAGDKVVHFWVDFGQKAEIRLRWQASNQYSLWLTKGDQWVSVITVGPGKMRYLQVTKVSDRVLTLHEGSRGAM